jgi:hypothetical protein
MDDITLMEHVPLRLKGQRTRPEENFQSPASPLRPQDCRLRSNILLVTKWHKPRTYDDSRGRTSLIKASRLGSVLENFDAHAFLNFVIDPVEFLRR